jgi:MFS family permease
VGGQALSSIGTVVSSLVLPLLVLALSGDAAQTGLVAGLQRLPYLLLALPAGILTDRWDRRWIMIGCDLGRASAFTGLAVAIASHHVALIQLYGVALVEGTLFTVFNVAEMATLPTLVAKHQVAAAFALREGVWSAATVVGPPLGGMLYGLGHGIPFAVDGISYLGSALSLVALGTAVRQPPNAQRPPIRAALGEAVLWLTRHRQARTLTLLSVGFELALSGTLLTLIVRAQRAHVTSAAIGLMLALGALGTTAGYLMAPPVQRRVRLRLVMVMCLGLLAVLASLYVMAVEPLLTGVVMAAAGVTASLFVTVDIASRTALVPDDLQGRLQSLFGLCAFGVQALSVVLGGLLIQHVGTTGTLVAFAACLGVSALVAAVSPDLRSSS